MSTSGRDQTFARQLLDSLKKALPFSQGVVLSTLPRGDLQIVQPSNVSEGLVKAYANGFHTEDLMTWQAIVKQKPTRADDCWEPKRFAETPYYQQLLQPAGLRYVAVAPLTGPVLPGYPGAVHLLRSEQQGNFTDADLRKLTDAVAKFRPTGQAAQVAQAGASAPASGASGKGGRKAAAAAASACAAKGVSFDRPPVYLSIVNEKLQPQLTTGGWTGLDADLRDRMAEQARRQMHSLNGHFVSAERLQVPDSYGDHWVFRQVTYRRYPALGNGSFTFFCLQPDCCEWGLVRPADFQADPELSRLIPALRFMETEFARGPGLSEIARTVDLSPFHFHRRFTELLGLTPKQFMLNCQVYKAKAELLSGEKELVDIAKDCGFAHQSHFTSRFKQASGLTPTRWRRMARQRLRDSNN